MIPPDILRRPTLVLNRAWQPVHVTHVARALSLLFAGSARVVEPETYQLYEWEQWAARTPREGEPLVRGVRMQIAAPDVIVLVDYDRMPRLSVGFSRRNLMRRDRFTCQYCGEEPDQDDLTVDHVLPRSRGGPSSWENCVLACRSCNRRKADKTLQQAGMRLRRQPVRPIWRPDFKANVAALTRWAPFLPVN